MSTIPVWFASLAIVSCLAITCFDIATGLEHWPFGAYPMYSTRYTDQLSWLRLYGVTAHGEILLRGERDFAPFDQSRLVAALPRIAAAPDGNRKLPEALRNLMSLYNRHQADRSRGEPIRGLRLYRVRWTLRAGMQGSESPAERILIAQVDQDQSAP